MNEYNIRNDFTTYLINIKDFQELILSSSKTAETVVNTLKDLPLKTISYSFPQKVLDYFVKSVQYILEREKIYDNKTIKTTNTQRLQKEKNEMMNDIRQHKDTYDLVINIDKYVEKFNEINEELKTREKDIVLEKIFNTAEKIEEKEEITER